LKGSLGGLAGQEVVTSVMADLPLNDILTWVEEDPENRAGLIAHAAPKTLDDENGGRLTRELITRYPNVESVKRGISASFHSGGLTGLTSEYLKQKRDRFRGWLSADFHFEVTQWIESEIEYLDERIEHEEIQEERSRFE
jgi:hypothetical protein